MPYIPLQSLLRPTTTLAEELFLTWFYATFDNGGSANKKIINVEPLLYNKEIAATEFLVYAATKLYISISTTFYWSQYQTPISSIGLYDFANSIQGVAGNYTMLWDSTAVSVKHLGNDLMVNNTYFSRITNNSYLSINFIGYRITLQ